MVGGQCSPPQWVIQLPPPVVEAGPGHARRGQL